MPGLLLLLPAACEAAGLAFVLVIARLKLENPCQVLPCPACCWQASLEGTGTGTSLGLLSESLVCVARDSGLSSAVLWALAL